jgi:Transposase
MMSASWPRTARWWPASGSPMGWPGWLGCTSLLLGRCASRPRWRSGSRPTLILLVGALLAAGYQVYAVNPLAASRYRERHTTSRAKSDRGDARMLADLVRTDRHHHLKVAGDSSRVEAIKVLARGHQQLVWARQRQANLLRSALRALDPAAVAAFGADLAGRDAVAVLSLAPTPDRGQTLSQHELAAALRRAGRRRGVDARAAGIQAALTSEQLQAPPLVATAYGQVVAAAVAVISSLGEQITQLEAALTKAIAAHPDAPIVQSQPGLGVVLGARVLPRVRRRPHPLRQPEGPQGLRRHRANHPRLR